METKVRKIGNSSGVILPKTLIEKYNLTDVVIEDNGDGIVIRPAITSKFQIKLAEVKRNKEKIYSKMKAQAEEEGVKDFYTKEAIELGEIDNEILDL
jgi:antitoxin component of MazEF toxin-antitoxin module